MKRNFTMAESRPKRVCRLPERCHNYYRSEMLEFESDDEADRRSEENFEDDHTPSHTQAEELTQDSTASEEELPEGQYRVERLIAKREKGKTTQFLVLWKGFPNEASQWLNADDIDSTLRRQYANPLPQEHIIKEAVGHFTLAIDKSLRVDCIRNTTLRIPFRHDVARFLFKNKDELTQDDFNSDYFPYGWNQWYRKHGDGDSVRYYGRTIVFPVRIECYLQWTRPNGFVMNTDNTVTPKQQTFVEMLRVDIVKTNC